MQKGSFFLILITMLFLSGCQDSNWVDAANETREKFGGRIEANQENKEENGKKEDEFPVKEGHWYTWNIPAGLKDLRAPDDTKLIEAKVINVVDGDTIDVQIINGSEERIRLILIDTPESKGEYEKDPEPFAIEAYEFTKKAIQDRTVWLEIDKEERDQYGRLLAYIWLDDVVENKEVLTDDKEVVIIGEKIGMVTLNALLLKEGLANVAVFPPNIKYQKHFEDIQGEAKKEKRGIWN
ncbi:thermonuclease family protein [Robertmurraya massiliosenegalensis]|uniref:thermonuclease family protein n=1 Tax=Robertmurraya massiliosenegalensis TaxID=1287657 RepID=UPI0003179FE4|nr:thermonuclease family protein [Robertmurraya massiliosenegalensis]